MDERHYIQHIDFEYGVTVLATPPIRPGEELVVDGGYGHMCPWKPSQRLIAYKAIIGWLEQTIEEMEDQE